MRDFCLFDPSGVLWRIGQNSEWNNQRGITHPPA
jgi:hypothetical protein